MEKYRNLTEYCSEANITIEELKESITNAALALSTSAAHKLSASDIEVIAHSLNEFNDILESIE